MAIQVVISSVVPVDDTLNNVVVYGQFVLSGSYPLNGDTVDFSKFSQIPSNAVPLWMEIIEGPPAGTAPNGYNFIFCPGTNLSNGVIAIFSTALTQFATGAYSAGLTGAVINFQATFRMFA